MTLYPSDLFTRLTKSTLLLDTNVFSVASRSEDFSGFLTELKNKSDSAYATIPNVVFEVTLGSSTIEVYNQRADLIKLIVDSVLPVDFIDKIPEFNVIMAKLNASNRSFTDFQLAACLYKFKHSDIRLMTTDLKAFPPFFEREFLVTTEQNSGDVVNFGIFKLNEASYLKAINATLKAK